MASLAPKFSRQSIEFLRKASRQKKEDWLDQNRESFEELVRGPLTNLAVTLAKHLRPHAPGYHFPSKGLGRLKRSSIRAQEHGSFFRSYVSFTITRPSASRFDHNPSVFFMINSEDDEGDEVLLAGGLYMPSSRQLRAVRERISENPEPFEKLFRDKAFRAHFPHGFSDERMATRPPRGFDPNHTHIDWLKRQGFFVWRSYKAKDYASPKFPERVAKDARQILRLNELLEQAITGRWPEKQTALEKRPRSPASPSLETLGEGKVRLHTPDF